MERLIRKTVMLASSLLAVTGGAFASDAVHVDGPFSAIGLGPQVTGSSIDGSLVSRTSTPKQKNKRTPVPQTLVDLLVSRPVRVSDFADDGIMIAVEKKDRAGNVRRQEAIVSIEPDTFEESSSSHQGAEPEKSRGGIALSLGDDRQGVLVYCTTVGISVEPRSIKLPRGGASVEINVHHTGDPAGSDKVQVYPRDPAILHWDARTNTLTAVANDVRSEIFVARSGQLVVVPVIVGNPVTGVGMASTGNGGLALPPELVRLPGSVGSGKAASASLAIPDAPTPDEDIESPSTENAGTRIHATAAEAASNAAIAATSEVRLRRSASPVHRRSIKIKLTDDRSPAAAPDGVAFPVAGNQLYVAGAEFSSMSDAHGGVSLLDVPAGSHLIVVSNDPSGNHVRSASTIDVPSGRGASVSREVIVPRTMVFDTWTRMAGLVQDPSLGSLCLDFHGTDASGVRSQIDVKGSGPFHFNGDGIIDHALGMTSTAGRVCWFNVHPGPVNVSSWQRDHQVMALEFPVLAGRHTHERVSILDEVAGIHVQFARESSAHEQLGGKDALDRYVREDNQDAVLVTTVQQLTSSGHGTQGVGMFARSNGGSAVVYLDAPDFEPSIHRVRTRPDRGQVNVLPAQPRGFVQDMAVYAQRTQDFSEGSVLVEFGEMQGQGSGKISMRLVNEYGQDVGDAWVFSDLPVTKAMFFNVAAGMYSVIVESESAGWLAAEAVSVYGETISVVQAGSLLAPALQGTRDPE